MTNINDERNWPWHAISLLVVFWFVSIAVVISTGFFQKEFYNPDLLIPLLSAGALSSIIFSYVTLFYESYKKMTPFWWVLYVFNSILISAILVQINWNQSLFFFLYLVNIIAVGLTLKSNGSYLVGIISLIGYNFAILSSYQSKLYIYLSTIVVNNVSIILVSYLSGKLSDYFDILGIRLDLAHKDIRKIKNLHELILSKIPSGILTIDVEGHLVHWNERAAEILSKKFFKNKNLWMELYDKIKLNSQNELGHTEISIEAENGYNKIIRTQRAMVKFSEIEEKIEIFVIEDVTNLREMEENLRNQQKLAAVGKLAAGIAHEIRNPLASISGSVQLLSSQAGNEEDKKLFNIVIKETDRLNLLITEFLDYAKPLPPPTEHVKLIPLINEVLELIKFNQKLRTDVKVECLWQGDHNILGYKDKLKQAFLNIIINAYQALESSITPIIIIRLDREGDQVIIRIKDNGSGMKNETRNRIFEPFFTTKVKGTGLGLAVTHKIFEAHGASIMVESEEGRGTEFVIKVKEYVKL